MISVFPSKISFIRMHFVKICRVTSSFKLGERMLKKLSNSFCWSKVDCVEMRYACTLYCRSSVIDRFLIVSAAFSTFSWKSEFFLLSCCSSTAMFPNMLALIIAAAKNMIVARVICNEPTGKLSFPDSIRTE